MQKLTVVQKLDQEPSEDVLAKIVKNLLTNSSDDFKTAFSAGCSFNVEVSTNKKTTTVSLISKYPISILKDLEGKPISVYEKR